MVEGDWAEVEAKHALCQLIMDDQKGNDRRVALPKDVYRDVVAPFLRFLTPLPNQLYAVGGRNCQLGPLNSVEMFDTWHGRWVLCPNMAVRRAGCAASVLDDGRMLVLGGYDERGIVKGLLASCEIFDPAARTWTDSTPMGRARWGHGCASLDGKVYAVGGCSLRPGHPQREAFMETLKACEVFDPIEKTWTPCASLLMARAGVRLVPICDRHLAAVGGCDDVFGRAETLPTVELFDVVAGVWSLLDDRLSTPRTTAAVVALDDSQIIVMGGAPSLATAEVFEVPEPTSDGEASPVSPRKRSGRNRPTMTLRPSTSNASLGAGQAVTDMAEGRMGCQAVVMQLPDVDVGATYPLCTRTCVVVVGGESGQEEWDDLAPERVRQFSSVLVYDIEVRAWRPEMALPEMLAPRTAMALCVGPGMIRH